MTGPLTVAQVVAWMVGAARKRGIPPAIIARDAMKLPMTPTAREAFFRQGLLRALNDVLHRQRVSGFEDPRIVTACPALFGITMVSADGERFVVGYEASPDDWHGLGQRLLTNSQGELRKSDAAFTIEKLIRKAQVPNAKSMADHGATVEKVAHAAWRRELPPDD